MIRFEKSKLRNGKREKTWSRVYGEKEKSGSHTLTVKYIRPQDDLERKEYKIYKKQKVIWHATHLQESKCLENLRSG